MRFVRLRFPRASRRTSRWDWLNPLSAILGVAASARATNDVPRCCTRRPKNRAGLACHDVECSRQGLAMPGCQGRSYIRPPGRWAMPPVAPAIARSAWASPKTAVAVFCPPPARCATPPNRHRAAGTNAVYFARAHGDVAATTVSHACALASRMAHRFFFEAADVTELLSSLVLHVHRQRPLRKASLRAEPVDLKGVRSHHRS